jgi:ferredoxin
MKAKILRVDPISCDGHGICAELLPEWIRLDDWGYPVVRSERVPPHLLADARWAVTNCPALALRLQSAPATDSKGVENEVPSSASR